MDPEGAIQKFLEAGGIEGGGERPDISHLINRKPKSKKKSGTVIDRPKKKGPSGASTKRPTETDTPSYADDEEDNDDEGKDFPVDEPIKPARKAPTPATTPTPAPAKKAPAKVDNDELYMTVLTELYDSLDGKVSNASRGKVVEYLKARIEGINDPKKREATVAKIAEKVGIRKGLMGGKPLFCWNALVLGSNF